MPDRPGLGTLLLRGLRRRCPACASGRIFRTFLSLRRACPECGWVVEREPGTVTGAMYLVAVLTQILAAALFFAVWLATDWTAGTKLAVVLPVLALLCLLALPVSRGLWVAVEYYTDLAAGETQQSGYARRAYEAKENGRGEAEDQPG